MMPSGKTVSAHPNEAFCLDCHQGSASGVTLKAATAELGLDEVGSRLRLPDLHNNPAGATRFGRRASGGYEYVGRRYAREYRHSLGYTSCDACHDRHTLEVKGNQCESCHIGANSRQGRLEIRLSSGDFDGDRDTHEGIAREIDTLREELLDAIEVYALRTRDVAPIAYQPESPWFVGDEGRRYRSWTPRLARAAYNYLYTGEEGGYSHNPVYLLQLLHDSLSDLGANMAGMTRAGKD